MDGAELEKKAKDALVAAGDIASRGALSLASDSADVKDALAQLVRERRFEFRPETLVWRAGWATWMKNTECQELSDAIGRVSGATPPPLPNIGT